MKDKQPKITTTKVCDVHTTQPNVIAFSFKFELSKIYNSKSYKQIRFKRFKFTVE